MLLSLAAVEAEAVEEMSVEHLMEVAAAVEAAVEHMQKQFILPLIWELQSPFLLEAAEQAEVAGAEILMEAPAALETHQLLEQ